MNRLEREKRVLVTALLADGASVRSVERVTGVNRDTVLRVLVEVGDHCHRLLDERLQRLTFAALEVDELWSFVYKKQRRCTRQDSDKIGDQFVYVAQDPESKLVADFELGKRTEQTTHSFLSRLSGRVSGSLQVSTDGFAAYKRAVPRYFGPDAHFMQIIKTFASEGTPQHPYQPPQCVGTDRVWVQGFPQREYATTSHVEAQNVGCRMAMKRLARLTLCFSKKWDNLLAALRLHFAEFNFVRKHRTLGTCPAVAYGLLDRPMQVADLVPT